MHPDRSHIHHLLLDAGLTHSQATAVLVVVNLAFILFVVSFQGLGNLYLLIIILLMASALTAIPYLISKHRKPPSLIKLISKDKLHCSGEMNIRL
jgi:hypothetical protein